MSVEPFDRERCEEMIEELTEDLRSDRRWTLPKGRHLLAPLDDGHLVVMHAKHLEKVVAMLKSALAAKP